MNDNEMYITIDHLDDFERTRFFRIGDILTLRKDKDNDYDDEAILVFDGNGHKCGYVANSVATVARGTFSAGRLYDLIGDDEKCVVRFILSEEGIVIARICQEICR